MPLLWLSLAFLLGIFLASIVSLSLGVWLGLAGAALGFVFIPRLMRRTPAFIIPLAFCALFIGAARYQAHNPEITPEHIAWYNDGEQRMVVVGVVEKPPDMRDNYIQLRVKVEQIRPEDSIFHTDVSGVLLARAPTDGDWHYGDRVVLMGYPQTPPEDEEFSYRDYLARQGVYSYMPYAELTLLEADQGKLFLSRIYSFKDRALGLVYQFFPDPEASLLAGILLGVESGIDEDVQNAFRDTGTTHIIAISGFNITIVAGLFSTLFGRMLGRVRGAVMAAVAIAVYTILVGADAAVVRAAIMGGLALFARQVGRRQDGINSLMVVAAIMTLANPMTLWDVGFQLSFMATLGLVLYADPFKNAFISLASRRLSEDTVKRLSGPVSEYFLFTLAAQLTTLPLIVLYFQRFSLSSFLVNAVILPVQPPIMILGGLAVLVGAVIFPLGQIISYLTWPFLAFTIRVVEWFAQFSGGVLVLGEVSWVIVLVFYVLLFLVTFWKEEFKDRLPTLKPVLVFSVLAVVVSLTWQAALSAPDGRLHVTILDVGTGDAILIQTPEGRYVLVSGGPSSSKLSTALGRRLPLFHRQLDFLVVASPREEQVAALPRVVERFPPTQVLWAGPPNMSSDSRYLQQTLAELNIPIITAEPGYELDLGEGVRLEVLTTGKRGAILLLTWEDFRMLLPIGAEFESMEALSMGGDIGPVTALLLADSGYAPLNPSEWIQKLNPQVILISVRAGDYNGLPSPETLEVVEGYTLLRTDQNGWIQITTDGVEMWVEVGRE